MVSDLQIPECIPCALSCVKHYTIAKKTKKTSENAEKMQKKMA